MALVTTTVSPDIRITPFTGLSETIRERSGIARAEVVYSSYGLWPASGAGDNRSISYTFSLDPAYGYVLMDSSVAFIVTAGGMMLSSAGALEITTDSGPGGSQKESQWYPYVNRPGRQNFAGTTPIGDITAYDYNPQYPVTGSNAVMIFALDPKPTALLYPFPGVDSIDFTAMFSERAYEQPQYAYRFYTRFLQYDITQGYNYVVNSPLMTR